MEISKLHSCNFEYKDLALEWAKENNIEGDLSKVIQDSSFNKK